MKITICIGSSCHLKGSRQIVERFQSLVTERKLSDRIELAGTFCMGDCQHGVCVRVDGEKFSVTPDGADAFFENQVLTRLQATAP